MEDVITGKTISARPPQSITNGWTVAATLAGAIVGCAVIFWLRTDLDSKISALVLMACVFVPTAFVEMFVNLAPEKSGLDFTWRSLSMSRIARKLVALWIIFAILTAAYTIFPVYEGKLYERFQWLLSTFGWLLVLVSIPYVAMVDVFQREPEDRLWSLGNQIMSGSFKPSAAEINYLLGWVVKGFFLPLMFCYLVGNIESLRRMNAGDFDFYQAYLFEMSYTSLYFVDLTVGVVGYAATLRLLGTEIRSAEPTLLGWMVALVCYEPFWFAVGSSYLVFDRGRSWGELLADHPVAYTAWGFVILFLVFIYAWSTVSFGIRFSNLTHRGIITSGPYRWTKHPAYIAKNLSWWLVNIPFLPQDGSWGTGFKLCIMLGLFNFIYYLRAKTEERHLSQDPVYREYTEFIRRHGLFRFLSR
jgi:protein-S-isoprenylcysteine O-methyltransferase Ste14